MAPGGKDRPLMRHTSAADGGMSSPIASDERRLRRKEWEDDDPARAWKSERRSFLSPGAINGSDSPVAVSLAKRPFLADPNMFSEDKMRYVAQDVLAFRMDCGV